MHYGGLIGKRSFENHGKHERQFSPALPRSRKLLEKKEHVQRINLKELAPWGENTLVVLRVGCYFYPMVL